MALQPANAENLAGGDREGDAVEALSDEALDFEHWFGTGDRLRCWSRIVLGGLAAGHERNELVVGPRATVELADDLAVAQHGAAVGDLGKFAETV